MPECGIAEVMMGKVLERKLRDVLREYEKKCVIIQRKAETYANLSLRLLHFTGTGKMRVEKVRVGILRV